MCAKTFKRVKVICFTFWCLFYTQNLFVKKLNRLEIVLITSLYYTTTLLYYLGEWRRLDWRVCRNAVIHVRLCKLLEVGVRFLRPVKSELDFLAV